NDTLDSSPYGNDATCSPGTCPTFTSSGVYGGAYVYDGTGYLNFSDANLPMGNSPFTMCAWANISNATGAGVQPIVSYGDWGDSAAMFMGKAGTCDLYAGVDNNPTLLVPNYWCDVGSDVWTHICFTYDGTDASLYSDGQLIAGPTPESWNVMHGN